MEPSDQLEEFVKKQLAHYEELPSVGLWGRIAGAIPLPNKVNKPPWFWWLIGAIVGFSGLVTWHFYSHHQWNVQLQEQAVAIQELRQQVEALQFYDESVNNQDREAAISEEARQVEKLTAPATISSANNELVRTVSPQTQEGQPIAADEDLIFVETTRLSSNDLATPLASKASVAATPEASEVKALQAVIKSGLIGPLQIRVADFNALHIKPVRSARWAVGAWFEGTNFHDNPLNAFWNRRRRAEDAGGNTPSFYANNPSTTKTIGLFLDFDLDRRWSVRTGVGYKDQRRPLGGDFIFAYALDNSQMNALGHSVRPYSYYDENHNIGISTIIANALSNEPNGLEPGELFEMDFAAYQQTRYVSIPLWFTYQMGDGRLKYHIRTGLVWNDLIGNSSKIRYLSFSFSQLYYQGHAINDGTIQVGYLDAGLGYGLEYDLNPRFRLYVDGVMYKSITPIFDRQPFSLGLGGGLRYQF